MKHLKPQWNVFLPLWYELHFQTIFKYLLHLPHSRMGWPKRDVRCPQFTLSSCCACRGFSLSRIYLCFLCYPYSFFGLLTILVFYFVVISGTYTNGDPTAINAGDSIVIPRRGWPHCHISLGVAYLPYLAEGGSLVIPR